MNELTLNDWVAFLTVALPAAAAIVLKVYLMWVEAKSATSALRTTQAAIQVGRMAGRTAQDVKEDLENLENNMDPKTKKVFLRELKKVKDSWEKRYIKKEAK